MNKAEFFRGIDWEAPLSWGFLTKLYGYSMYDQQFLADVLTEYEKHGRDKVKYVYQLYVNLEELHWKHEIAPIAREFAKQIDTNYERQVKEWQRTTRKPSRTQNYATISAMLGFK